MISKWVLKAVVQKTISFLPGSERINYLFQKFVTRGVQLSDEHFRLKITHAKDHIAYGKRYVGQKQEITVLELGTGWYPVIPIAFYLSGVERIISLDIQQWLTRQTLLQTIQKFIEWRSDGELEEYLDSIDEERWTQLTQIYQEGSGLTKESINASIGLNCIIQDARQLTLADHTVDLICSNNTLEHISRDHLTVILQEFTRVLKGGGVMSHFIDMSDHFAHFDTSISIYNFLKFSRRRWKLIDNTIQPQNRLRFIDYKKLYEELGIPVSVEVITNGKPDEIKSVSIHKEFATYSPEDLAISHCHLVSCL